MTVDDLTTGLETVGMDCTGPTTAATGSQWVCTADGDLDQRVEITGASASSVTAIRTTIDDARNNQALVSTFLSTLVGLLPFDDGSATEAQEWLEDNFATGGTRTFDGIAINLTWQGDDLTVMMSGA